MSPPHATSWPAGSATSLLSRPSLHDILLAVSEAVTNVIEHGSGCDASKLVSVQASVHNQAVTATVSDSGRWIDSPPRPDSPTQRGRGLILINGLANNVDIARTAKPQFTDGSCGVNR
jgi:anti-sigma regulatory factor (Ser/Thr protein kinase)